MEWRDLCARVCDVADVTPFGTTADGRRVHALILRSQALSVTILTFGAVLQDVRLRGVDHPLTLGSPSVQAYEQELGFFGSIVGPVVNRIRDARAVIDGTEHRFPADLPEGHTLHMGRNGLHTKLWDVVEYSPEHVCLSVTLPDGEAGMPGTRKITATFTLTEASLTLEMSANTDKATLMNIANHSYWNLDGTPTYKGHVLRVAAPTYLVADDTLMPTGEVAPSKGTPFDFTEGKLLTADTAQFCDHNLCLSTNRQSLREVAELTGTSGVTLTLATTETGLQVFDGNGLSGGGHPTHTQPYGPYAGLALETQSWPGATTFPHFPQFTLAPCETYATTTRFTFSR